MVAGLWLMALPAQADNEFFQRGNWQDPGIETRITMQPVHVGDLVGELYLPPKANHLPALLALGACTKPSLRGLAQGMADHGYTTLALFLLRRRYIASAAARDTVGDLQDLARLAPVTTVGRSGSRRHHRRIGGSGSGAAGRRALSAGQSRRCGGTGKCRLASTHSRRRTEIDVQLLAELRCLSCLVISLADGSAPGLCAKQPAQSQTWTHKPSFRWKTSGHQSC